MTKDVLRYDKMVESAMRGVVREALSFAAQHGLPGGHHFYVTFRTGHPGVVVPESLRARYPSEMTIVLEHQFWELTVTPEAFAVTLSFENRPERLTVPLAAVTGFADPSVKFGLQFQENAPAADALASGPGEKRRAGLVPVDSQEAKTDKPVPKTGPEKVAGGKSAARATPEKTEAETAAPDKTPVDKTPAGKKPADVVTLDAFRKK